MTDMDRRPRWPWIGAALILLPILYTALFGPLVGLCWWMDDETPTWLIEWTQAPDPIDGIIAVLPNPQSGRLHDWYYESYLRWWADLGHRFAAS